MRFAVTSSAYLLLLLSTGCYQTQIEGGFTTLARAPSPQAELVLVETLHDETSFGALFAENSIDRMMSAAPTVLTESGVSGQVLPVRDVGRASTASAFLVRIELERLENRNRIGGRIIAAAMCSLVIPCFFIGTAPAIRIDMRAEWTVRVYDIRGMRPTTVRDSDTGEVVATFDVALLAPIYRERFEARVDGGLSGRDNRDEETREEIFRRAAEELMRRGLAEAVPGIERSMRNALSTPPPAIESTEAPAQSPTQSL